MTVRNKRQQRYFYTAAAHDGSAIQFDTGPAKGAYRNRASYIQYSEDS
jgi:hypothetical protein